MIKGREALLGDKHNYYLGVLVGLDAVPWLLRCRLVDDNVGSVLQAVADVTKG